MTTIEDCAGAFSSGWDDAREHLASELLDQGYHELTMARRQIWFAHEMLKWGDAVGLQESQKGLSAQAAASALIQKGRRWKARKEKYS